MQTRVVKNLEFPSGVVQYRAEQRSRCVGLMDVLFGNKYKISHKAERKSFIIINHQSVKT